MNELGLTFIWNKQFATKEEFRLIKQKLFDRYNQTWLAEINASSKLKSYSIFKDKLEIEPYIDIVTEKKHRIALTKFRTSSHNLAIETGRYDNSSTDQRICKSCNMNRI